MGQSEDRDAGGMESEDSESGLQAEGVAAPDRGAGEKPAVALLDPMDAFRRMLFIRRFEEKAGQLYAFGDIGGYCHLSIGQEAAAVGLALATERGDQIITGHRCHGPLLALGGDPTRVMAELAGKAAGICAGKGGSMHLFAPEVGFYGGHGIVGACAPLGAGLALANRQRRNGRVAWVCFGDRAADQGQVAETMEMAARWRLPLVLIIENNEAGNPASVARQLWRRGEPFGIPGETADGVSVAAVREACLRAGAVARSGGGPRIVEVRTYSFRGHLGADDATLSAEALQARREHEDPIERARAQLLAVGLATRDELRDMDDVVRDLVYDIADAAQAAPEPETSALTAEVVADV